MVERIPSTGSGTQVHEEDPFVEAIRIEGFTYKWGNPPLEDIATRLAAHRVVSSKDTWFFPTVYAIEALCHAVVYLVTNLVTRIVHIVASVILCDFNRVSSEGKDLLLNTARSVSFIACIVFGYLSPWGVVYPGLGVNLEKEGPITEDTFKAAVRKQAKQQVDNRLTALEQIMTDAAKEYAKLSRTVDDVSKGIETLTPLCEKTADLSDKVEAILNKLGNLEKDMKTLARDTADRYLVVQHSLSHDLPRQIREVLPSPTPSASPSEGISGAPSTPTRALPLPPKKEFMKFFNEMKECYTAVTREIAYVKIPTTKDVGRVIAVIRQISQSLHQRRSACHGDVRATLEDCLKHARAISDTCKSRGATKDEFVSWLNNLSRVLGGLVNKVAYAGMTIGVISQAECNDLTITATFSAGI